MHVPLLIEVERLSGFTDTAWDHNHLEFDQTRTKLSIKRYHQTYGCSSVN